MAVEYLEVMGALGSIAAKHPQSTSLAMQTYSLWNSKLDEAKKIYDQYLQASAQATGTLDKAGVLMQLLAMHPDVSKLLLQTIAMWQTRIPDLIDIITEFQEASSEAYKS